MSGLNLDNFFHQKLQNFDVPFKSEYWTQMEEKLESSAPIGSGGIGSGISKIYLYALIFSTSALIISGVMFLNNHSNDEKQANSTLTTSIIESNNTEVETIENQTKLVETNEVVAETISTPNTSKAIDNKVIAAKPSNKTNYTAASTTKTVDNSTGEEIAKRETDQSSVYSASKIKFDEYDNLFVYNRKDIVKNTQICLEPCPKKIENSNELIVITPMDKPAKRVFKQKRGLLYKLGLRK